MRFFVFVMLASATMFLAGCEASATVGAPATPPPPATLAPAPTPQPLQVIYVQPPPAAAAAAPARDDGLFVVTMALMFGALVVVAAVAYLAGRISTENRNQSTPAPADSYLAGMYRVEMTPAEYGEWAQLQAYKARQIAQANREVIHVRR